MGLGDIYVNLQGREDGGVVAPGRGVRGAARRAHRAADGPDRPEERRARRLARLQARGRLQALRPAPDPRPDRDQPAGLPRLVAVLARRAHRQRLRGQPRRLERRPLLARSRTWCAASSSPRSRFRAGRVPGHRRRDGVGAGAGRRAAGRRRGGEARSGKGRAHRSSARSCSSPPGCSPRKPTPADSDRQADLAQLQGRIGTLKARSPRARRRTPRSPRSSSGSSCKLEIATREGELVAATREEFARRLAAVTAGARRGVGGRGRVPPRC